MPWVRCARCFFIIEHDVLQYSIRVSAENSVGEGEPSSKQTVKTLSEAPEGIIDQWTWQFLTKLFCDVQSFKMFKNKTLENCPKLIFINCYIDIELDPTGTFYHNNDDDDDHDVFPIIIFHNDDVGPSF